MHQVQDIELHQGDTLSIPVVVTEDGKSTGTPIPIDGVQKITWALASRDEDPVRHITKTLVSGITITDGPGGAFTITVLAADTADVPPGRYYHQARITDGSGNKSTVFNGEAKVFASILEDAE